jgi:hypothetical protein
MLEVRSSHCYRDTTGICRVCDKSWHTLYHNHPSFSRSFHCPPHRTGVWYCWILSVSFSLCAVAVLGRLSTLLFLLPPTFTSTFPDSSSRLTFLSAGQKMLKSVSVSDYVAAL